MERSSLYIWARTMNKLNIIFYFGILATLFMSAATNAVHLGIAFCMVLSFFIAVNSYSKKDSSCITFGFLLIILQNLLIGIGAKLGNNQSTDMMFLTQFPTVYIYVLGLWGLSQNRKFTIVDYVSWIIILIIGYEFVISSESISSKLVYVRNCSIFYFCYLVGKNYANRLTLNSFSNNVINISLFLVLIGIFMMLPSVNFWKAIGVDEVYISKGTTYDIAFREDGFPVRYFTRIGDIRLYRMASILYEPVNLSYILCGSLLLLIYNPIIRNKLIKSVVLLVGIILTVGKGGILILIICIIYELLIKISNNFLKDSNFKRILFMVGIIFVIYFIASAFNNFVGGSSDAHFKSIIITLQNVFSKPFGYGLGTGGNYGSNSGSYSNGQESGLMSVAYQMGIPFLIFFCVAFILIFLKIKPKNRQNVLISFFPLAILIASLFQENTFGPQCIYIFIVSTGILLGEDSYGYEGVTLYDGVVNKSKCEGIKGL